jgi:cyclopropane-fatty-acyl-phospholipid synthase
MKNTLQSIFKHKYSKVLENIGDSDITHHINFKLFQNIVKNLGNLRNSLTTQGKFLMKMGIKERAEIISKNQSFTKKADIYYRLKRLVDDKQMGKIFKVMMITNKKNKFNLGF